MIWEDYPNYLGKRQGFSGTGSQPTFWPFIIGLETVMVPVGELLNKLRHHNEHIKRLKVYESGIFRRLGPHWFQPVYVVSAMTVSF